MRIDFCYIDGRANRRKKELFNNRRRFEFDTRSVNRKTPKTSRFDRFPGHQRGVRLCSKASIVENDEKVASTEATTFMGQKLHGRPKNPASF